MAAIETVTSFRGFNVKLSPLLLESSIATAANNVDLSAGVLQGVKSQEQQFEALDPTHDTFTFYRGNWRTQKDAHFLQWKLDQRDLLFELSPFGFKKFVNGVEANVGQDAPGAITITASSGGTLPTGNTSYAVTFYRNVNGMIDESEPVFSDVLITSGNQTANIPRPANYDPFVTFWRVYRLEPSSGSFKLVSSVPIATASTTDNGGTVLGTILESFFQASETGAFYSYAKPPALDGIAKDQYGGMIFGWAGSKLYWTIPGIPDAWPEDFFVNFPSNIVGVARGSASLLVVTDKKTFFISVNNPFLVTPSEGASYEGAAGPRAWREYSGAIVFASNEGIQIFDGSVTRNVTAEAIDLESFFALNPASAKIEILNDVIYVTTDQKTLCLDLKLQNLYTLSESYSCLFADGNDVFGMQGTRIYKLFSGDRKTWTWSSKQFLCRSLGPKYASYLEFLGQGSVTATVRYYLAGEYVGESETPLDFSYFDGRCANVSQFERFDSLDVLLAGGSSDATISAFILRG